MSRTQNRLDCDTPYTDGKIFFGVGSIFIQAGGGVATRNAAGDISINQAASQAGTLIIPCNGMLERTGLADLLQEQFGGVNTPASVSGFPPFPGASQLVPVTANRPKGLQLTDVTLIYQIGGAALTGHTIRVDKTSYVNNAVKTIAALLAVGANGLQTAIQANPYVTKVPITPANIAFNTTDNSELIIEIAPTTQVAGTYRLYGGCLHYTYNFN